MPVFLLVSCFCALCVRNEIKKFLTDFGQVKFGTSRKSTVYVNWDQVTELEFAQYKYLLKLQRGINLNAKDDILRKDFTALMVVFQLKFIWLTDLAFFNLVLKNKPLGSNATFLETIQKLGRDSPFYLFDILLNFGGNRSNKKGEDLKNNMRKSRSFDLNPNVDPWKENALINKQSST